MEGVDAILPNNISHDNINNILDNQCVNNNIHLIILLATFGFIAVYFLRDYLFTLNKSKKLDINKNVLDNNMPCDEPSLIFEQETPVNTLFNINQIPLKDSLTSKVPSPDIQITPKGVNIQ